LETLSPFLPSFIIFKQHLSAGAVILCVRARRHR